MCGLCCRRLLLAGPCEYAPLNGLQMTGNPCCDSSSAAWPAARGDLLRTLPKLLELNGRARMDDSASDCGSDDNGISCDGDSSRSASVSAVQDVRVSTGDAEATSAGGSRALGAADDSLAEDSSAAGSTAGTLDARTERTDFRDRVARMMREVTDSMQSIKVRSPTS